MKPPTHKLVAPFCAATVMAASATSTFAGVLFTDDFQTNASASWSNLRGNWLATNGVYFASNPQNVPPTYTGLPFMLGNFTVDVDINQVADGGVWLRCDPTGTNGVLLVTGGHGWGGGNRGGDAGQSLYWHVITPQNWSAPAILNEAFNVFTNPGGQSVHLHVEVMGNVYAAFLNGSTNATTTLVETNLVYASGGVGLYDYSGQTFDNFVLQVPADGPYSLSISGTDSAHAVLSWPTSALGWNLEASSSLAPADWNTVTNTPTISGTNFALSVGFDLNAMFFRLHKR
jgi:hypothetical protein